ncbi:MAG TPA: Fe-S protein assembly co-chaperone HscB [Candidatus Acidoferrum sp.]|nr:Fe-S protein assembly co-chaperone HscB [Candidatus Acidoferrum sp.]
MNAPKSATISSTPCWSCNTPTNAAAFCPACGKIQSLPASADYFTYFGLPHKLWMGMDGLEQKFLQLSWKLHPDNFVNADEREREMSLQRSSRLNDAYRVLRDPVARVEYLLELDGMRKEGEHKQQAPPELLEEVFELNESLDELREAKSAGANLETLTAKLRAAEKNFGEKLHEVDAEMKTAAQQWDAALDANAGESDREAILQRLNELLNRRSYIRNLVAGVEKELREASY